LKTTVAHDGDAIREHVGFFEEVCGEKDAFARIFHLANDGPDQSTIVGI
jgi:hypothetical protein